VAQTLYYDTNRSTTLPGVYSEFRSGINNAPLQASFGNVLIIDTGKGTGYAGGAGINGTLESGINSIRNFSRLADYRDHVKGSELWLLAEPLFQPNGAGNGNGAPSIFFVKAATTAPAVITYTFTGGGTAGGVFAIQVRDEGTCGNGVETSSILTRGYAAVMRAGTIDVAKFVIDFYVGTFKGLDAESDPWDFIAQANTLPKLLASSVEFANVAELYAWATSNTVFQSYFAILTQTVIGTGVVDSADLASNVGNELAAGGTETYSTDNLDLVLDAITNLDYTFVIAPDNDVSSQSADNSKILAHLNVEAKYRKFMMVGGSDTTLLTGTNSSSAAAAFYNSPKAIVVHSGVGMRRQGASGFKNRSSLYKVALVTGKLGSQEPQVPLTFKKLNFQKDRHELNTLQQTIALRNGVLATIFDEDFGSYIVLQGVNTKQTNTFFIDSDGTSYEISVESIKAQVAKELQINSKLQLLGQSAGVNRNTLKPIDLKQWTEVFLSSLEATDTEDNLLISSKNVTVDTVGDTYRVNYQISPNFPINKLHFIATIYDSTIL
jgi:hypothetical protein